jgi:uncharacterized protein (TIGR03085 family)
LLRERAALCDTFSAAGPNAPTLCEGWVTEDLAAHLVARETRPDSGPGLVLPGPFAAHTERVRKHVKAQGYERLIERLRGGPPVWFRIGPMAALNVVENFIHHEDVRRAAGEGPRPPDPELDAVIWKASGTGTALARRRLGKIGLVLRTPDGRERVVKDAEPRVVLTGAPGELALFMSGRKQAAVIEFEGPPDAVAAVMAARFGV